MLVACVSPSLLLSVEQATAITRIELRSINKARIEHSPHQFIVIYTHELPKTGCDVYLYRRIVWIFRF